MRTKSSETRTRLLQSARELFSSVGYDRTTLRDIADGANANAAAVYYHFRTKEAIFTQLVEEFCEKDLEIFSRVLQPAKSSAEVPLRLEIFFEGLIGFHLENTDILRALSRAPLEIMDPIHKLFSSHVKLTHKMTLKFLTEAQSRGFIRPEVSPKIVNHILVSALLHPVHAPHAGEMFPELNMKKESARREFIHSLIDVTLNGILKA